jgi:hypothetical protein
MPIKTLRLRPISSLFAGSALQRWWAPSEKSKRQPCIPARRAVLRGELAVGLQVEVSLHVADRKQVSELRTDSEHARPEAAEDRVGARVVGELLIKPTKTCFDRNCDMPQSKWKSMPFWYCVSGFLKL